jgi:two-component system, OmpR family, phosphate regulon response regulator PhoB
MLPITVLIVEDDLPIAQSLSVRLNADRFCTLIARNTEDAKRFLLEVIPDIVLLNPLLRHESAAAFANRLCLGSHTKDIPLVLLGNPNGNRLRVDERILKVAGYVARPPSADELIACIEGLMRHQRIPRLTDEPVSAGGLRIEPASQSAFYYRDGVRIGMRLSQNELGLLYCLMLNPDRVHTRTELLEEVWAGRGAVDTRTVDSTIYRLRTSLRRAGCDSMIEAVHSFGYKFATQVGLGARSLEKVRVSGRMESSPMGLNA